MRRSGSTERSWAPRTGRSLSRAMYGSAPDRALSFPSNVWEFAGARSDSNYTYYVPLQKDWVGKKIDAVVLALNPEHLDLKPEVWLTAYPAPYKAKELILVEGR